MSQVFTESALVDRIKETWLMYRDKKYLGGYYYHIIDQGVFHNTIIPISLEHLGEDLRNILRKEKPLAIRRVIYRAILEIFNERPGLTSFQLEAEDRIRWKFV